VKRSLRQQLGYINRSHAKRIVKNLYSEFEELNQLRTEGAGDLRDGLSALKRALAFFNLELEG
jgi:hypothetical protein